MVRSARLSSIAGLAGTLAATVALAACASGDGRQLAPALEPPPPPPTAAPTTLPGLPTSVPTVAEPALDLLAPWVADGLIPSEYGCGTDAVAPPLTWFGVGDGVVELLLTVAVDGEPVDALVGIPPTESALDVVRLPAGAFWWPPGDVGRSWSGACGDAGDVVTFSLYALNQQLEAADDASVAEVVSIAELTATAHDTVTGPVPAPATTSSP